MVASTSFSTMYNATYETCKSTCNMEMKCLAYTYEGLTCKLKTNNYIVYKENGICRMFNTINATLLKVGLGVLTTTSTTTNTTSILPRTAEVEITLGLDSSIFNFSDYNTCGSRFRSF